MGCIALLTDFGLDDHYVGVLHAVLENRAPGIPRIDLGHGVPPGDLRAGAFLLRESWTYLPEDTVVLVVIDPGVGGPRKAVAVRCGSRHVVGPDNGILRAPGLPDEAVDLGRPEGISTTFHGRDLFAPAAARLAMGAGIDDLGIQLDPLFLVPSPLPDPVATTDGWDGEIIHVDHFGNLITNIPASDEIRCIRWREGSTSLRVESYGQAPEGEIVFLHSSSATIELGCREASAALKSGLKARDPIRALTLK